MQTIEHLLLEKKKIKRPLTTQEIVLNLTGEKSERNVYKEVNKLLKFGVIQKVKFECWGYKLKK